MEKDLKENRNLPELLAPAGSYKALEAAIDAGADAVYLGVSDFNARMYAKNFTPDELREGAALAHDFGAKIYVTLNTQIYDRELRDFVKAAENVYLAGADALIIADAGAAQAVRKYIPDLALHASTQMSAHNGEAGKMLASLGYSRYVIARETPYADILRAVRESPIEVEMFVHGALCVSHSGQCLFSSLVGGRSGNRGECAQACRLPYRDMRRGGRDFYPLSLKDLSLCSHIPEIISSGVASLKIEGRMKSPEYVHGVVSVFRKLLDERRCADRSEEEYLASLFSRGGFTDGYFRGKIDSSMLGVRSEKDKEASAKATAAAFSGITRKLPIDMKVSMKNDQPIKVGVRMSGSGEYIYSSGDVPQRAINSPIDRETLERSVSKLGNTPYSLSKLEIELDEGLMLPISALNSVRREATEMLGKTAGETRKVGEYSYSPKLLRHNGRGIKSAVFYSASQISDRARKYFDRIFLPADRFGEGSGANGVILPPVIFPHEEKEVKEMLSFAATHGATCALVGNLGHIRYAKEAGLVPIGDFRLGVMNSESARLMYSLGFEEVIISPELTLPQMRDIGGCAIVYGRIPLMLTEKCVGKELGGCEACRSGKGKTVLFDRRGAEFPVLYEYGHRSVVYNSVKTYMGDRQSELEKAGIKDFHFIFSDETRSQADEVIECFARAFPLAASPNVRRIIR